MIGDYTPDPDGDVDVLAIIRGGERYIFMYTPETRAEALRMMGRFASNKELSFCWYDAAVLSQKMREVEKPQGRK